LIVADTDLVVLPRQAASCRRFSWLVSRWLVYIVRLLHTVTVIRDKALTACIFGVGLVGVASVVVKTIISRAMYVL
jgi:hypothetical protein